MPSRPGEFHPEPLTEPDFDTLASDQETRLAESEESDNRHKALGEALSVLTIDESMQSKSIVILHNHDTSPNILDDVFGLRGRCLLPVDVDRKQTRVAVSECSIVERHASVLFAVFLEDRHRELLLVVYRPNLDGMVLACPRPQARARLRA